MNLESGGLDLYEKANVLLPGVPCKHPGCQFHVSHACEGCGRYAAGMINEPETLYDLTVLPMNANKTFRLTGNEAE